MLWRKKILLLLLLGWAGFCLAQDEERVIFSSPGGFYESSFQLSLDCFYANHHIRYTTNGATPTAQSTLYTGPLTLDENLFSKSDIFTIVNCIPSVYYSVDSVEHAIILRAAVFNESEECISDVATNSYFIQSLGCNTHGLPVTSIVTDSLSLFDYETGIFIPGVNYDPADSSHTGNYCQTGREWERLINVEFYEPDNTGINQQCGLRIHGGASRWFQQKGLRIFAREEYGKKRFKHRFFESTTEDSFKHLNLHPFRCSNWLQTGGQEYMAQIAASQLDIDALAVRETVVFINGEYWGIYTMEESPDERYLEDHYDIDIEQVNILKYWGVPQYGDPTDWRTFFTWLKTSDLSNPDDAALAYSRIDVPSFIDYMLFELYSGNLDWPQNNVLHWQAETGSSFRWIFFDGDGCFSRANFQAIENATHSGGNSVMLNHFLENEQFRNSFYERYIQLLSTTFSPSYLQSVADNYGALVEDEIELQSARFGFPKNKNRWLDDMEKASNFFLTRNEYFQQELLQFISIEEPTLATLTCVPNPSSGCFHIKFYSNNRSIVPIKIYDPLGRLLLSKQVYTSDSDNDIYIETNLPAGLYLVKINNLITRIVIE